MTKSVGVIPGRVPNGAEYSEDASAVLKALGGGVCLRADGKS